MSWSSISLCKTLCRHQLFLLHNIAPIVKANKLLSFGHSRKFFGIQILSNKVKKIFSMALVPGIRRIVLRSRPNCLYRNSSSLSYDDKSYLENSMSFVTSVDRKLRFTHWKKKLNWTFHSTFYRTYLPRPTVIYVGP